MLATKVTMLGEYIKHHVKEEQKPLAVRVHAARGRPWDRCLLSRLQAPAAGLAPNVHGRDSVNLFRSLA